MIDDLPPLPDLVSHRAELHAEGAPWPLPLVPFSDKGLLRQIPNPPGPSPLEWPWDRQTPPPDPNEASTWPHIHVVIPSFRQGAYIEAALRSVLLQNYPRLTLAVLDAGSDDGTRGILESYRPWLSYLKIAPDKGQAHAINRGLSLGPGTGLEGWLNSDDLYLPGALHAIARTWCHQQADFIYGDGLSLDQATGRIGWETAGWPHPAFRRYPGTLLSHATFWSAALRQPLREQLHCALDYELWIRMLPLTRRRCHIARPLGLIRIHPEAKSHSPAMARRWGEDARLNGLAHPALYRPAPFRRRIHHWSVHILRIMRSRRARTGAHEVCASAGWSLSI